MAKKTPPNNFEDWATAVGANTDEVQAAWEELQRPGLVFTTRGKVTVPTLAMRRATSDVQRRLASLLSGYMLTDNSYDAWLAQGKKHAVLIPQRQISNRPGRWEVRARLLHFLNRHTAGELSGQLWWLPQDETFSDPHRGLG